MINIMSDQTFIFIILGTMVVTYIPRMLPLVLLNKVKLSKRVEAFLDYIPIAILGSILFSTLLYKDGEIAFTLENDILIAGIFTIVFAKFVKRIDLIVIFGIVVTFLLRQFI